MTLTTEKLKERVLFIDQQIFLLESDFDENSQWDSQAIDELEEERAKLITTIYRV